MATETTKTPRVRKPPAEVVGTFEDVMNSEKCIDGRNLYFASIDEPHGKMIYIRAATDHQAAQEVLRWLDVQIEQITGARLASLTRAKIRSMMAERDAEETQ